MCVRAVYADAIHEYIFPGMLFVGDVHARTVMCTYVCTHTHTRRSEVSIRSMLSRLALLLTAVIPNKPAVQLFDSASWPRRVELTKRLKAETSVLQGRERS